MVKKISRSIENFIESQGLFGSVLEKIMLAALIILIGCIIMKLVLKVIRRILDRTQMDQVLYTFVENTIKVLCWITIIVTALGVMGVPTTTFITVLGACGAAVALALRDSLSNFAGGILIIFNKPFEKDDLIELVETGNTVGKVKQIDLLYSTLTTPNNQIITVPNGLLANHVVINHSRADRRRIDCKFGIGYDSDIDKARSVIKKIIEANPIFLTDPEPVIGVSEHSDSAVIIDALVWCRTENYYIGKYRLMEDVKLAFDKEGIEIPYQHIVIKYDEDCIAQMKGAEDVKR
ncbi:MAG: mechanosensitive ion channel family protein [Anaerovoracaceae bacterium]